MLIWPAKSTYISSSESLNADSFLANEVLERGALALQDSGMGHL